MASLHASLNEAGKKAEMASMPAVTSDTNLDSYESWPKTGKEKGIFWWIIVWHHQSVGWGAPLCSSSQKQNKCMLFLLFYQWYLLLFNICHKRMFNRKKTRNQVWIILFLLLCISKWNYWGYCRKCENCLKMTKKGLLDAQRKKSQGKLTDAGGSVLFISCENPHPPLPPWVSKVFCSLYPSTDWFIHLFFLCYFQD
jgi:hypothetical protein